MTRVLAAATVGAHLVVSYESPRGTRQFDRRIEAIRTDDRNQPVRVRVERGSAAWMFVQRARIESGEYCWCFFQPNPYPIVSLALVTS
jgi:hypothetical protein